MSPMTQSGSTVRRHQRILVPPERGLHALANGGAPHLEGVVTVIGLGGMFIRTSRAVPCGAMLNVKITHAFGALETNCIVRDVAETGLGVEFAALTPENESRLRDLLSYLKPPQPLPPAA